MQGRKRNIFQRRQNHFSWFFFPREKQIKCQWFWKVKKQTNKQTKKKKKKKKRNVSSFFNFSAFQFATFPFSIFLLINFFPCLFFPGKAAVISRSEVWGHSAPPRLLRHYGSQHWKPQKLLSHPMPPEFLTKMRSLTFVGPYIFSIFLSPDAPGCENRQWRHQNFFVGGHRGGKM